MKPFSQRIEIISALLAFLGLTLIGLSLKLTLVGILLFIPNMFVELHTYMIKNNLKHFSFRNQIKICRALIKGEIM